jgi:hypothetical protein
MPGASSESHPRKGLGFAVSGTGLFGCLVLGMGVWGSGHQCDYLLLIGDGFGFWVLGLGYQ